MIKKSVFINKFVYLQYKSTNKMGRKYDYNDSDTQGVSEPVMEYGSMVEKTYRVISEEEIARCIPLEESRRRLTEKIYRFYHPEA